MSPPVNSPSLYRRLLIWLLVPMLALGTLMLVQAYFASRDTADRAFDRLLESASLSIAEQVKRQQGQLWMDLPPSGPENAGLERRRARFLCPLRCP